MFILALLMVLVIAPNAYGVTYYHPSYAGSLTASGDVYSPGAFTAAHPSLPFGTEVEVCWNGCVVVVINDRCACDLDLSGAAAETIGMVEAGNAPAPYTVL